MKEGYRNNLLLVAWVSVFFLHLHVVKSKVTYLKARADKQDIKSLYYPQNYPKYYSGEWLISAPEGYRIRLEFQDFNLGTCARNGALLEVWTGDKMLELCGQKLPPTIESFGSEMELFLSPSSQPDSQGGRFWARYKMFNKNEVRLTQSYTTSRPIQDLSTGDGETNNSSMSSTQRLYLLISMMGCVIFAVIVALYCGCRRKRPTRIQSPTPANVPNNADLEIEDGILELNFGDAPPSYEEVTRQSVPDISSITQQPSGESSSTQIQEVDSSGLPSYREALRLSQQSLDTNV